MHSHLSAVRRRSKWFAWRFVRCKQAAGLCSLALASRQLTLVLHRNPVVAAVPHLLQASSAISILQPALAAPYKEILQAFHRHQPLCSREKMLGVLPCVMSIYAVCDNVA
jgi:hypothetical protein